MLVKYTDVDSFSKGRGWLQYQISYRVKFWEGYQGRGVHARTNKPSVRNRINVFSRAWLFTASRLR